MKRAILILAATGLLGATGCGRCDRETLTVNWTFIDGSNAEQTCDNSGTVAMEILVNGVAVTDDLGNTQFTCAQFPNSITLFDVPIGVNDVEFDAFDANNQLIVQQAQSVDIRSCGNTTTTMSLAMQQAPIAIDYSLSGTNCISTDVIWYSLTDITTGVRFIVDAANNPGLVVTCGSPVDFSPAPFGPWQLDAIEIVDNRNPAAPQAILTNCSGAPAVNHLGFDSIPITLFPAAGPTAFCQL
jgi:hypothetical protein